MNLDDVTLGGEGVYDEGFYASQADPSRRSAERIVPLVLQHVSPTCVIDVGCGVGAWLSVFRAAGIDDVTGLDGDYVPRDRLRVPPDRFVATDLTESIRVDRVFDLAVSVEVAEHLPPSRASGFVDDLCRLSDHVLFSAAVPGQVGREHINAQWPSWWAQRFADQGFAVRDVFRSAIWDDDDVAYWYRQNLLLFSRGATDDRSRLFDVRHPAAPCSPPEELVLGDVVKRLPGMLRASVEFRRRQFRTRRRPESAG